MPRDDGKPDFARQRSARASLPLRAPLRRWLFRPALLNPNFSQVNLGRVQETIPAAAGMCGSHADPAAWAPFILVAAHRAEELEHRYGLPAAQRFYKLATARLLPLSMALEAWLKERETTKAVTRQTRIQDKAAVKELIEIVGDVGVTEIDRALAISFVRKKKEQGAEGVRTLVRKMSSTRRDM